MFQRYKSCGQAYEKTLSWKHGGCACTWREGAEDKLSGTPRNGEAGSSHRITEYKNYRYKTAWQVAIFQAVLYLWFKKYFLYFHANVLLIPMPLKSCSIQQKDVFPSFSEARTVYALNFLCIYFRVKCMAIIGRESD